MNEQRFPAGWDERRVQHLLAELDARTDDEWVAADEKAAAEGDNQAVAILPAVLLPEIQVQGRKPLSEDFMDNSGGSSTITPAEPEKPAVLLWLWGGAMAVSLLVCAVLPHYPVIPGVFGRMVQLLIGGFSVYSCTEVIRQIRALHGDRVKRHAMWFIPSIAALIIGLWIGNNFHQEAGEKKVQGDAGAAIPTQASTSSKGYTFAGFPEKVRDDLMFQDFTPRNEAGKHVNVVQYLWADAFSEPASWVRARVVRETTNLDGVDYLDIQFQNNGTYPSNIAIRPKGEAALKGRDDHPLLTFEVRSPAPGNDPRHLGEISLGVRIVDANYTHWEYGFLSGQPILKTIKADGTWQPVQVDLKKETWVKFDPDGNHLCPETKPDFSVLTSLVLEFGGGGSPRPGRGAGTLQVRRIRLEPR